MLSQLWPPHIHTASFLLPELHRPHRFLLLSSNACRRTPTFHFRLERRRPGPRRGSSICCCGGSASEWELKEAAIAVSTFLQGLGVSEEESLSIASKSPSYSNMLVESVRDLDQHSMWNSDSASLGFREKLLHIASLKGDNGKLPYFESLGFTLSSSITLARYLSSQNLPSLMHKVASIKDLFFSHQADHLLINNIRRMMLHLSIPIDDDLQHTLSFFEKLEARRGGLNVLLSDKDTAFRHLIDSFPRLLSLSLDNHIVPIIDFLHNIGVPRVHITTIILSFPPILFWNIQLLKARLLALKQIHVVDKDYIKLLIRYPWVLSTSIQENYEEVHGFFLSEKVRKICIDSAIRGQPYLLGCSTSKLKSMLDQLADLGVKGNKLDRVIARSPQLLLRKPRDFLQVVLFFENMGLDREIVGRILSRCPEIFAASINKTLKRKIEFLSGVGVSEAYLPGVIRKYPELLVTDTDKTILHRLMYLMKLGLSEKEIGFMVRTFSPLLGYSIEEVLRPKIEFLVKSMERPVREVVDYPRYFSYSLEKKIKPRYFVLKGRHIECSLKDMLGKNDEEFAAEFMGVGLGGMRDPPLGSENGLLSITKDKKVELLTDEVDGLKFKLTDGVDIAKDGTIYFTDASYKYLLKDRFLDLLEGKPHGRFMSYDPTTKKTEVLVHNLYFPNGVAVSPDQQFVIFFESVQMKCKKYYIEGPKKGSVEKFCDNLPGYPPDNIHYDEQGQYWIGLGSGSTPGLDIIFRYPLIRKALGMFAKYVTKMVITLDRKPIGHYSDPKLALASGIKIGDHIYWGSLFYPFILLRLDVKQYPAINSSSSKK